jgi:hypothetical protein
MTDKKISEFPSTTTINYTDSFTLVQSGGNMKVQAGIMKSYFSVLNADLPIQYDLGTSTISIRMATTSLTGATQLSNSYTGTSEVLAVTEKALKDGLDHIVPTSSPWLVDGSNEFIYTTLPAWDVYTFKKYKLNVTSPVASSAEFGVISTPFNRIWTPSLIPAQGIVTNASYNSGTDSFIFKYNSTAVMASGFVTAYSLSSLYEYAYYNTEVVSDTTITADRLYNGYADWNYHITFMALFRYYNGSTDLNASDGTGVINTYTGVSTGGAAIDKTNWLDLAHYDHRYVSYSISSPAIHPNTGCIRFMIIPAYYGAPDLRPVVFFEASKALDDTSNLISIIHYETGNLTIRICDKDGNDIVNQSCGYFSAISGNIYEIALDYDITTGKTRIFVDGAQFGTTSIFTGLMDTNINLLQIGHKNSTLETNYSNFKMANLAIYNSPQFASVGSYTPGYYLETTNLKRKFIPEKDSYIYNADSVHKNICIGNYTYGMANVLSSSFGQLNRTSYAYGLVGNKEIPLWVLNGQYKYKTDKFFMKSDGNLAWCHVITATGSDFIDFYSYSTSSPVDIEVGALTVLHPLYKTLAIDDNRRISFIESRSSRMFVDSIIVPGSGLSAPEISAKYTSVKTFEYGIHDTLKLPKAVAGMELYIDLNFGNVSGWFHIIAYPGDTIHGTDPEFIHEATMHRLTYSAETDTNWVVKSQPIIDNENNYSLPVFPSISATFYATYKTNINGTQGYGTLTGTAYNGASVSNGKLDLTGGGLKHVVYDATKNADFQQLGAIKFKLTPNFSGSPADIREIFTICKSYTELNKNTILLYVGATGHLTMVISDVTGTPIKVKDFGVWSPTSGTQYEFELDINITDGATRLFINGIQFGTTVTETGTRTSDIACLLLGCKDTNGTDFYIEDFVAYNYPQHAADYIAGYTLVEYQTIINNQTSTINDLRISEDLLVYGTSTLGDVIVEGTAVQNSYHAPTTDVEYAPKKYIDIQDGGATTGITAHAGGGQGSATAISSRYNFISVCATGGDSIKLPGAILNLICTIKNNGSASCDCFPQTDEYIDGVQNVASAIANGTSAIFVVTSVAHWERI